MADFEHALAGYLAKPQVHCALGEEGRNPAHGLAQLVLTLLKMLHEVLERQAIRRMDAGSLSDADIERVGSALQAQRQEVLRLAEAFGLQESDLKLDLGPLGSL